MKNNFFMPGLLWILLSLICVTAILYGLHKAVRKAGWGRSEQQRTVIITALVIAGWACLVSILSYQGFFSDFSRFPPRLFLALFIPLPVVLTIAFSKKGTTLLQSVPAQWLVFIQSFRIFVEILLWLAFLADRIPVQMTFEGMNLDVLSGILALPAGYVLLRRKTFAKKLGVVFNIIGIILLLNILIIAVLSMPTPLRYFMNEPSNTLVGQFPFVLLPGLLVPVAYSFHIFSLRQLLRKNKMPG